MRTLSGIRELVLRLATELRSESAVQAATEQVFPRVLASLTSRASSGENALINIKVYIVNVRIYQRLIS